MWSRARGGSHAYAVAVGPPRKSLPQGKSAIDRSCRPRDGFNNSPSGRNVRPPFCYPRALRPVATAWKHVGIYMAKRDAYKRRARSMRRI